MFSLSCATSDAAPTQTRTKCVDKRLKTRAVQLDIVSTVQFEHEIKVITNLVETS